jgi:hypothetical protein
MSFTTKVILDVSGSPDPFTVMESLCVEYTSIDAGSPGVPPPLSVKVTDVVWVTLLEVPVTVAEPAVVPAIRETTTTPVSSVVDAVVLVEPPEKVPRVVEKVTEVFSATAFPALSVRVAVIEVELDPSAGMLVGSALSVIDAVVLAAVVVESPPPDPQPAERKAIKTIRIAISAHLNFIMILLFRVFVLSCFRD